MKPETYRRPHTLYRFYDAEDRLLYVGITADPGARWIQHRRKREWWTDVTRIALEVHPNRWDVLSAERRAIAEEAPLFNVLRPKPEEVSPPDPAPECELTWHLTDAEERAIFGEELTNA